MLTHEFDGLMSFIISFVYVKSESLPWQVLISYGSG